jgi:hypothetical protein
MKAYDIGFVCLSGNDEDEGDDDDDSSCNFLTAYNAIGWVLINGQDYL